jgi:hypothetical protein
MNFTHATHGMRIYIYTLDYARLKNKTKPKKKTKPYMQNSKIQVIPAVSFYMTEKATK